MIDSRVFCPLFGPLLVDAPRLKVVAFGILLKIRVIEVLKPMSEWRVTTRKRYQTIQTAVKIVMSIDATVR